MQTSNKNENVLGFFSRSQKNVAKFVIGGNRMNRQGYFIEPTIMTDVDQKSEIVQKEVFGPLITIQKAEDNNQAN